MRVVLLWLTLVCLALLWLLQSPSVTLVNIFRLDFDEDSCMLCFFVVSSTVLASYDTEMCCEELSLAGRGKVS